MRSVWMTFAIICRQLISKCQSSVEGTIRYATTDWFTLVHIHAGHFSVHYEGIFIEANGPSDRLQCLLSLSSGSTIDFSPHTSRSCFICIAGYSNNWVGRRSKAKCHPCLDYLRHSCLSLSKCFVYSYNLIISNPVCGWIWSLLNKTLSI